MKKILHRKICNISLFWPFLLTVLTIIFIIIGITIENKKLITFSLWIPHVGLLSLLIYKTRAYKNFNSIMFYIMSLTTAIYISYVFMLVLSGDKEKLDIKKNLLFKVFVFISAITFWIYILSFIPINFILKKVFKKDRDYDFLKINKINFKLLFLISGILLSSFLFLAIGIYILINSDYISLWYLLLITCFLSTPSVFINKISKFIINSKIKNFNNDKI